MKDPVASCKPSDLTNMFENEKYTGIFLGEINNNVVNYLPKTIKAKAGEKIDLPVVLGGYTNANDYLFWVYLNWEQCELNSDYYQYRYLRIPDKHLTTTTVNITAPETKGEYELCTYLAVSPWLSLNKNNIIKKAMDITSSRRITLCVE